MCTALAAITLPIAYGASGPLAAHGTLGTKLYLAGRMAAHYVRNVLDPRFLSIEYPELRCATDACKTAGSLRAVAGLAILAACFAGAAAGMTAVRRAAAFPLAHGGATGRWRILALAWVAIWLAALGFVVGGHEPGVDRHAYVLVAALAVALASLGAGMPDRAEHALQTAAVVAAAVLAVLAHDRIGVWRNDLALWSAALRESPASARVHHNLAAALAERGRLARARHLLARATDIDPTYWPSHLGFAGIDCERGRFAAARMRIGEARVLGATAEQVAAIERRCAKLRTAR
jgi:Tfp pilus assembly protein PilF